MRWRMTKTLARFAARSVGAAFNRWQEACVVVRRTRGVVSHAAARFGSRSVACAFAAWVHACAQHARRRALHIGGRAWYIPLATSCAAI